ncbi:restriction endonuclease subunit S [Sporolactobacillus sp. Y61]|uniref:Restriction endonuclease subunit S n=1 Tax=Sporolactobacillus sp. Y61 TaxID=3160863 RepID=A0AAU8IF38_9BACL
MRFKKTKVGSIPSDWSVEIIDHLKSADRHAISMGPFGSKLKKSSFVNHGIPIIRGNNLRPFKFWDNDFVFVTEEKAITLKSSWVKSGDIVITHRGTLGQVGFIPKKTKFPVYIVSQSGMKLTCDSNKIDNKFLYYYLNSPLGQYFLLMNKSQVGVPAIARASTSLKKVPVPIPPLNEQKQISWILTNIDRKIEINSNINQNLEAMAQAIFKHWFVDFEFPDENGNPYKSSGGEMVESELGMIPKGWKVGHFSNFIEDIIGGDWGKPNQQGNYIRRVNILRGADILEIKKGNMGSLPVRYILEKNYKKKELKPGNLVIEISGGSPTQSTGRITYVSNEILRKFSFGLVCTNFCRAITLRDPNYMEYFYLYWKTLYDQGVFFLYENGTTGIKNLDIRTLINSYKTLIPLDNIIFDFRIIAQCLFRKIQVNGEENMKLAKIRDTLLPKLMSGEIRVPMEQKVR